MLGRCCPQLFHTKIHRTPVLLWTNLCAHSTISSLLRFKSLLSFRHNVFSISVVNLPRGALLPAGLRERVQKGVRLRATVGGSKRSSYAEGGQTEEIACGVLDSFSIESSFELLLIFMLATSSEKPRSRRRPSIIEFRMRSQNRSANDAKKEYCCRFERSVCNSL